jgi:predicted dehydrogenase
MSRTIRWGILGTGTVAGDFAVGLGFLPDARLAAVGSQDPARARSFAAHFGVPRAHGSYEALVHDPDVDVVYVASPNPFHKAHALLALEAGKPVLVEKPFALDAAEAQEVVALARRKRLFCMEAMWMRFSPAVLAARALIRSGELGEVHLLTAQLGFSHAVDATHRVFHPQGGGALLDLGVYPVSLAFFLLGPAAHVTSRASRAASGVDEDVALVLQHAQGHSVLAASLRGRCANEAVVTGTQGMLRLHDPLYFPRGFTLERSPPQLARGVWRSRLGRLRHNPWVREASAGLRRVRARMRRWRQPGNGYEQEAAEVMRCLGAGQLESPSMPLDETVAILSTLDTARRQWA